MTEPSHPALPEAAGAVVEALAANPRAGLVALDFDGTLSPIVPDPATSRLVDGGLEVLSELTATGIRVAVVTGRPAATVVDLGGFDAVPGLVVAGQYGAERWSDGCLHVPEPPAGIAAVRAELPGALEHADSGVWVEDKVLSLVVHTRRAADPDGELDRLRRPVTALAESNGLSVHPGRYVLEIRAAGFDKGGALETLVEEAAARAVVFAGDDVGDLPAFAAVEKMREHGIAGLTICAGSDEAPEVAERADVVVHGPAGVVALLRQVGAAVRR